MRFSLAIFLFSLLLIKFASGAAFDASLPPSSSTQDIRRKIDELQNKALQSILNGLDADVEAAKAAGKKPNCTRKTLLRRVDFGTLRKEERKAYTDAVTCLQKSKSKTPAAIAPGARGRNDDFTVTHILQTPFVHFNAKFLPWHRYFIHIYGEALRNECNYHGPIPYWDWPKYADAPQDSLLFNGDPYSMGSNGAWDPNFPIITVPNADDIPRGLGGGCVTKGPFKDLVVTLGPITLPNPGPDGGLGYNPRCMKRDVGPIFAKRWSNWTSVLETFQWQDIGTYQDFLQGVGTRAGGVHGGGHFTISGDPGGDLFVSTGDPAFYLHHAQMDRLWTLWQALDPENRQYKINGTNTMFNDPPSELTKLTDFMDVGYAGGGNVTIHNVMSTVRGPFCYVYA